MDSKLVLHFVTFENEIGLFSTEFFHVATGESRRAVRGRTPGAFRNQGVFQWSSAVQALAVLFLRTKYAALRNDQSEAADTISGSKGSHALSLDYAITKGPSWVADMFGTDSFGRLIAPRLFRRTNSNLKFPGPVVVAVNENVLKAANIAVTIDGSSVNETEQLEALLRQLELQCGVQIRMNNGTLAELREIGESTGLGIEAERMLAVA